MDKLEKALEKARLQRSVALGVSPPAGVADLAEDVNSAEFANVTTTREVLLPSAALARHRLVALSATRQADTFRILRTKVMQALTREGKRTLAITSPRYQDGKTTIALNLALSLALDLKQTVLLVDMDLRHPSVHRYLELDVDKGVADYLVHDVPIADCLVRPGLGRLVVLPAGEVQGYSSEILGSKKMAGLARELKQRYADRVIIYDMPPLLTQDDTMVFLPNVDGVLLVVQDGKTTNDDLKQSLYALNGSNVIGTVLNKSLEAQAA